MSHEFIGSEHANVGVSFFLVIGEPGQGPRLHKHNYDEIVYVISGRSKWAGLLMTLIEAYEEEHHPTLGAPPVEVLRTLMDANNLRQKDLVPILGSESIVSEALLKKRELNKTHIGKLSKRFHVSPAAFFLRTLDR